MQRSGLAVTAAVVLSMIPAAPPALAAPYVPNGAVFAATDGSIVEVGHRYKKYSRNYKKHRHGCKGCRSRYYARGYRYGYPYPYGYGYYRHFGGCVGYNGLWVCF